MQDVTGNRISSRTTRLPHEMISSVSRAPRMIVADRQALQREVCPSETLPPWIFKRSCQEAFTGVALLS